MENRWRLMSGSPDKAPGIAATVTPDLSLFTDRVPDPCALIIFGITGDLAHRKLIPALYELDRGGRLPSGFSIVGVGRKPIDRADILEKLRDTAAKHVRTKPLDSATWSRFSDRIHYVSSGSREAPLKPLVERLASLETPDITKGNRLFYMATPPSAFPVLLKQLHEADLIHPAGSSPWTRVIIEKPIGHDLSSAEELNSLIAHHLDESQTYRIDHYLGKETVQNILVFRFANAIFEPLWNRKYVDHVQIEASESIGIEGRGDFYDGTGVLRDIVQNHLLQVLALCAMEPPNSFQADDIRDEKVKVFRALRLFSPYDVDKNLVQAQFDGYREIDGVKPDSITPTCVSMKMHIDNWRWQGVPFYLRAGKNLDRKVTEVTFHFQSLPICLMGREEVCNRIEPNILSLRIQPNEGISLRFASKVPGDDIHVGSVVMNMNYESAFQKPIAEAYERLLLDGMRGDATLFARRDGVEASWQFIQPILNALEEGSFPMASYAPGSGGPVEAERLINGDGRVWHRSGV